MKISVISASELKGEELNLNIGDMQARQMEMIEEIYHYLFQLKKELAQLKQENAELRKNLNIKHND